MCDATASSLTKTISFRVPVVYGIIEHSTMDEEGRLLDRVCRKFSN